MLRLVNRSFAVIMFLSASLFLSSCANSDAVSGGNRKIRPFVGDWQGSGIDSAGNEFTFAAKVITLGDHKYRVLILDNSIRKKSRCMLWTVC